LGKEHKVVCGLSGHEILFYIVLYAKIILNIKIVFWIPI